MRWFFALAKKYGDAYYEDITRLKLGCGSNGTTVWSIDNTKCDALLSLYPKEWFITEIAET